MKKAFSIATLLIIFSIGAWLKVIFAMENNELQNDEFRIGFWRLAVFTSYIAAVISLAIVFFSKQFRFGASLLFNFSMLLSPLAGGWADYRKSEAARKEKLTSQSTESRAFGTSGISAAEQPRMPEAGGMR